MRWLTMAINFRDPEQIAKLRRTLDSLPERPRLLVDDTMARSMVGGDENSAKDVGEFIAAIDSTPADLRLVVHHSGYEGTHERGSSALQGAADFRASASRSRAARGTHLPQAQRRGGMGVRSTLRLEPHESGSCTLSRVIEADAVRTSYADRVRSDVLEFVTANAPTSKRAVRKDVTGKNHEIDDASEWLTDEPGKIGARFRRAPYRAPALRARWHTPPVGTPGGTPGGDRAPSGGYGRSPSRWGHGPGAEPGAVPRAPCPRRSRHTGHTPGQRHPRRYFEDGAA